MFKHCFSYEIKALLRSRDYLFWCLGFSIILATLFQVAFGDLSKGEGFAPIPTAVVLKESCPQPLKEALDTLSEPGEEQLLEIQYTSEEEAKTLLKEKKVSGILFAGEKISLCVSGDMAYDKLNQSILQSLAESLHGSYEAVLEAAAGHPEKLPDILTALQKDVPCSQEINYAGRNLDEGLTYFFNLIAMTCLTGSTAGAVTAAASQANLSDLGKRKSVTPGKKQVRILAEVAAAVLMHFCAVSISVIYMWAVLGVDLGNSAGYVFLAVLAGSMVGVGYGFFGGCIGKSSIHVKTGVLMAITMLCSFFSGLMVGGMKILVQKYAPWFNRINPAALISDSLYSLAVYESHTRYFQCIGSLFFLSILFIAAGAAMVRRQRYASL